MTRRFGVLAVLVLLLVGLAWAGVVNLRARRAALAANHVELIPAKAGDMGMPDAEGGSLKGKPAPAFTLVSTDGKKVSLGDFKGHPVIVNFWATWCGPCRLEMPWFEEFSKRYQGQGLVVLGLDQDDGMVPADVAKTAKRIGVSYPVLMPDKDERTSRAYGGVDYLPETFYIDREGKVAAVGAGAPSKDQMENLIQMAMNGK